MIYYRSAITNGILLLPLMALLPLLPYYWKHRHRGVDNPLRLLTFYSFILYSLIMWYFVVLPLPSEAWLATIQPAGVNLVPFSYFRDLSVVTGFDVMEHTTYFSAIGSRFALQYWFNILMMVPMGMYMRYLFRLDAKKTAIACFMTTLLFEVAQLTGIFFLYSKPYRSFDVDDLICNFLGGMLGYWVMGRMLPLVETIEKKAQAAYRRGNHVSLVRRLAALAIDLNVILGLHLLWKSFTGIDLLSSDLYAIPILVLMLFAYTLLFSLLLKGATPGKWLLRFRVCRPGGDPAGAGRILLRYLILYAAVLLFFLIPHFALPFNLTDQAMELLVHFSQLIAVAFMGYYVAVAWMFPSRDYPWGSLSGTLVLPRQPAGEPPATATPDVA